MFVTRTFAVTLLVSTATAFAPAFADDTANTVLHVAAVEAHAPVTPTTEAVPTVATTREAARTPSVLNAEEVRARESSAKETLRKRTVDLAVLAAEKAIQARLDEPKHRELIERFIDELESAGELRDA